MSAPVGNKFALGNKGGGRKSAFQEQADSAFFADLWNGRLKKEKIERKILKGKYGAKHILAVKILEGNEKLLGKLLDKFFPDQISNTDPVASYLSDKDELGRQRQRLNQLIEDTKAAVGDNFFEPPSRPVSKEEEAQIIKAFRNFGLLKEDNKDIAAETFNQ